VEHIGQKEIAAGSDVSDIQYFWWKHSSDLVGRSRSCAVLPGRLDGPMSSTLRSLARFNSGGHSSETEAVDGDFMDAVIRTATASMDRRPLRDRRRPSPANSASSASRDSVERQKCQFSTVCLLTNNKNARINLSAACNVYTPVTYVWYELSSNRLNHYRV